MAISWASVSPTSGDGDGTVEVTIDANSDTSSSRTGTLTFTTTSGLTATLNITQEADTIVSTVYSTPTASLSYDTISAAGGTVSPNLSYSQTVTTTYASGKVVTSEITSGATLYYIIEYDVDYASIDAETGIITFYSNSDADERYCDVKVTVTLNNKTCSALDTPIQDGDSVVSTVTTYSNLSIDSFYYGDETPLYISADAAEYSPTLAYSQTAKTIETYISGNVVTSTSTISSGATVTYSITMSTNGQSVDSSTGVLTIPEFTSTSGTAAVVVRATVVLNDESASATATVVQSAAEVTTAFYNSDKEEVSQFTFGSISSAGTCDTGMSFWADGGSSLSLDSDCATLTYGAATDAEAGSIFDWYGEIVYSGGGSTINLTPVGGTTTTYINIGTLSILDSDSTVLNSCSVYYDGFEARYYNMSGNQITSLSVSAAEYYDIGVKAIIRNGGTSTSTSSDVIGAIPDNYGVSWSGDSVSSSTYDYVLRLTPVAGAYDTSTTVRATEFVGSSYTVYSAFTLPVTWNYNRKISFAGTDLGSSFTYSGSTYTSSLSYTITATLNVVADVDLTVRIYYKYYIVPDGTAASTYTTITIAAGDLSGTASVSHTGSGSYSSGSSLLESPYIEFYSAMLTSTYGGTITFSY